jgi:hypothetical protein
MRKEPKFANRCTTVKSNRPGKLACIHETVGHTAMFYRNAKLLRPIFAQNARNSLILPIFDT